MRPKTDWKPSTEAILVFTLIHFYLIRSSDKIQPYSTFDTGFVFTQVCLRPGSRKDESMTNDEAIFHHAEINYKYKDILIEGLARHDNFTTNLAQNCTPVPMVFLGRLQPIV